MAQSTQSSLLELGIAAVVSKQGEDVRVGWIGPGGTHCAFVLTSVKTPQGESTRVHFAADKGADQQSELKVLADLQARHGKAA